MYKKRKKSIGKTGLLSLFLLFAVTAAVFILPVAQQQVFAAENTTEFAGGDGTEGNPYQVSTAEQLDNVRNYLDAYFIQTADIDLTEATAEGGTFYNDGSGWSPIGTNRNTPFAGNYDGGGHRIIGLKSKQSGSSTQYAGLFGYNRGVICNLGMENGAVSADDYAGGIAGWNGGSISNCYNTGTVSGSDVGGIAGYNNRGSISNCYNTGTVSSSSSSAGGIARANYGWISNCYNIGAVSGGGIAGYNDDDGSISNCYNTGAVFGLDAGGIARDNDGSISNCYYYDTPNLEPEDGTPLTLEELKQQASYVGFDFDTVWMMDASSYYPFPILQGITPPAQEDENYFDFAGGTGRLENPYRVKTMYHLNNVRNFLGAYFIQTADIDLTAATAEGGAFYNNGRRWSPIGSDDDMPFGGNYDGGGHRIIGLKSKQSGCAGLFGYNRGVIRNLGMEDGAVSADDYAGGIAGWNGGSISNCYNTGTVSSDDSAGGIAGRNYGNISNCYNTGTVSSSSSSAGGIVGDNYDGSISNCYNTGTVSAEYNARGIVGYNDRGSISNCYYYDAPNLNADGGTPLTLEALKQQVSYDGFDFDTVWTIGTDSYYPFPTLRGITPPAQEEENITEFAGGTGRLENPYQVSTPENLNNVRKYLGAYFIQTADIDLTAATAEGGAFYNNGKGWSPIGTNRDTPFGSNYDGGGYRIIGLKSKQSGNAGLFGYNRGVIRNLGMENGAVSSSSSYSYAYAGGIAGYNYGSISNCYNTGAVSASSSYSYSYSYAGGIAGYNSDDGSISNCYNTGAVSSDDYAGGIAGSTDSSSSISNCYNTGEITAESDSENVYAGGIAGYSASEIANVFNTGKVTAQTGGTNKYAYVGGLAGYTKGGSISYGYSTGEVQGSPQYTGKVVGSNEDAAFSRLYFIGTYEDMGVGNTGNSKDKVEFKTAEQMKQQATYVGFNFNTVWSISPDKNGGYPTLQVFSASEDVPGAPTETDATITLSQTSYDEATGTYRLTAALQNQRDQALAGTVVAAAYDGTRLIGMQKYPIDALAVNGSQTVQAEIRTNKKATQLKVFFWDVDTLQPLSNVKKTAG